MAFENFRTNRMNFNETVLKAQSQNKYNSNDGYSYWKLEVDKEKGTGSAIIRFLPPKDTELPYAKVYSHFFRGDDGKWCVVERCPTTYGEECPICSRNKILWDNGMEQKGRERKRRTNYVFNIYVVKDPANPENDGKVFLFKCGPAIFNMIIESMTPQFDGEEPKKPFDIYNGNNFNLRVRSDPSRGGLASYDKSFFDEKFTDISEITNLEDVYNEMVNLDEYTKSGKLGRVDLEQKVSGAYCSLSGVSSASSFSEDEMSRKSLKSVEPLPWDSVPDNSFEKSENYTSEPIEKSEDYSADLEYFKNLTTSD